MIPTNRMRRPLAAPALRCALAVTLFIFACPLTGCGNVWNTARGESPPSVSEVKRLSKESPPVNQQRAPYAAPARIAKLEDKAIRESSGVVASRRNPGLF